MAEAWSEGHASFTAVPWCARDGTLGLALLLARAAHRLPGPATELLRGPTARAWPPHSDGSGGKGLRTPRAACPQMVLSRAGSLCVI